MPLVFVNNSSLKPPLSFQTRLIWGTFGVSLQTLVSPSPKEAQRSFSSWKVTRCHPCLSFIIGRRTVLVPRGTCL